MMFIQKISLAPVWKWKSEEWEEKKKLEVHSSNLNYGFRSI